MQTGSQILPLLSLSVEVSNSRACKAVRSATSYVQVPLSSDAISLCSAVMLYEKIIH